VEGIGMRALLWKDYRNNRRLLAAIALIILIPYVVLPVLYMVDPNGSTSSLRDWLALFCYAALAGLVLSVITIAFVGGNVVAGERADRSAEFLAALPITRGEAITSKAVIAVSGCLLFLSVNFLVALSAALPLHDRTAHKVVETVMILGPTGVLAFGVSWLCSSFLARPGLAALSGLGAGVIYAIVMMYLSQSTQVSGHFLVVLHLAACPILAILCFIAGVICWLCRVEP
jgi:ABC-type transport system involved in multi-copper enzyme maturation permease subunit